MSLISSMFKIKHFPIFLLLLTVITIGQGCKGLSPEQVAAVQPVTIRYWTVFNDIGTLRQFAEQYKQIRPYVTIDIRQVRYEEFGNLFVNALADDVAPDIISVHNRWLRQYQPRLSPMPPQVTVANYFIQGKYVKEPVVQFETRALPNQNSIRTDYVSAIAEDIIINGQTYGLPMAMDTMALYYNKEILDRAGIAVPPATWEELLESVKKTTIFDDNGAIVQSGIPMGTGSNIDNAPDILALLMLQKGVDVMRNGNVTFANNVRELGESHPAFEALRFYTDFARDSKEVYTWNNELGDGLTEFIRGKTAFYIGYAFDQPRIRARAPQMRLGVLPIPQLDETRPVNIANYWVESVVAKSKHQQIAWDFVRFITSPENVQAYVNATGQPSPLRTQIRQQVEDPALGAFASAALTAKNWYIGRNVDVANQAFRDLIDGYLEPVPERSSQTQRDSTLLTNTARTIQQTL